MQDYETGTEQKVITYCDNCGSTLKIGEISIKNTKTGWNYCIGNCALKKLPMRDRQKSNLDDILEAVVIGM
tara:strand:- start:300 stop:512 length:213 start_codon:yes stop_codon:yes gene_type:complete